MWNLVPKTRLGWVKNRTLDSRPKGSWLMNSNPPNAQMFFVESFAIKEVYCNKNIQIHSRWRHTGGHEMLYLYRFIQEVRQNISTLHFWATEHRYVSYFSFFRNVCEILLSTLEVIWEKEYKSEKFSLSPSYKFEPPSSWNIKGWTNLCSLKNGNIRLTYRQTGMHIGKPFKQIQEFCGKRKVRRENWQPATTCLFCSDFEYFPQQIMKRRVTVRPSVSRSNLCRFDRLPAKRLR